MLAIGAVGDTDLSATTGDAMSHRKEYTVWTSSSVMVLEGHSVVVGS